MDEGRLPVTPDPSRTGRLTAEEAREHLDAADDALRAGEFRDAAVRYARVVGFDDPTITAAALLGLGEARYRLDEEAAALASWEAAVQLGETPSAYVGWRNIAAARVRGGDLAGAIEAYREADRRAPLEDKPAIANRLGWLLKEQGDPRASRRYFAKGRGDGPLISVTIALIAATVIVSASALLSAEGQPLIDAFALDKLKLAQGEYWRLWTVTLLHGSPLHLFFNMYALYLAGPIVERWYGSVTFVVMYLACAAAGSVASFVFGGDVPSVGASGAIFGLFGVLLAAGRLHHPIDRQGRMLVGQLGMLILINIAFGFAVRGIDNAAHLGGLAAGLWLGALLVPDRVQTMSSLWQRLRGGGPAARLQQMPIYLPVAAIGLIAMVVVVGLVVGTGMRA